ncbi:MAG: amidohydrolase family protein, partial [Myxococcales bacterium]|nr:amidohydrolase family protein [Myxococcales bacterium]
MQPSSRTRRVRRLAARSRLHAGRTRSRAALVALASCLALATSCASRSQPPATRAPATQTYTQGGSTQERAAPLLLHGARIMTGAGVIYPRGELLIVDDEIVAVGVTVDDVPAGTRRIDVAGKTITPGIIDTHSHMGVYASPGFTAHADGNEMVSPTTAYARAADGYWPQDPNLERARAGGVTTAQILPGSANLIGGRSLTIRLTPDARSAEDARFPGAPAGLKMACGENPKRLYGQKGGPGTRMGNVAGYRDAFQKAIEYQRSWEKYEAAQREWDQRSRGAGAGDEPAQGELKQKDRPTPPARDFGLETLAAALAGDILVHMHCYRADEMSLMLELAREFGFHIRSFHHAVEAYKIADRLHAHDTAASVWADWWGFKAEAFDGVRENAAMISRAGARAIIHSDSAIGIQRLNQEAAKAMYAGRHAGFDISDDEALRWITLNPAWALGVDDRTGSLEPGKLAD